MASTVISTIPPTEYSWASNTEPAPNPHQVERTPHLDRRVEDLTRRLAIVQAQAENENFALLLLDGSRYQFLEQLVTDGESGGATAAALSLDEVQRLFPGIQRIAVCLCIDVDHLTRKHRESVIILHKLIFKKFASKFSKAQSLYDIVNVGTVVSAIPRKLRRHLEI